MLNLGPMTTNLTSKLCTACIGYCSVKHVLFGKFLNFSQDQKLPSNSTRLTGYLTSVHSVPLLGTMVSIRMTNTSFMFSHLLGQPVTL